MPPACHFRRASEDAYATLSENEVAQPVAGVPLSPGVRRTGRDLFSTLGYPKALRHYLVCRRRALARKTGAYSHVCRRSGHAFEYRLHAVRRAGDELLEGLRCTRSGGCRDRDLIGWVDERYRVPVAPDEHEAPETDET